MLPHKNIRLLTWFNFFTDFKLYAPVAIIYFAHVSGSFALGMSIFSIAMVSSALLEIPTGIFSDFIGRKKTVILGAAAAVLYSIFYAIGQAYWILVIGAIFEGLSRSFYSGNNDALLHDTLNETGQTHEYSEFLGKTASMFQVGLAISAIAGSFIANQSFAWVMWLSAISQIICLCLSFFLVEPKTHSKESGNIHTHLKESLFYFFKNKKLRLLSLSSIINFGIGEAMYLFQSAFYNMLWPIWAIGIAKALSNITAAISFRFSGHFIKKYSAIKMIIASDILSKVIYLGAIIFTTILSPLFMSLTSLFYGIFTVSKSTLLQKEFKQEQRATMGSLNSFAGSIFFGIIALSLGFVADELSPVKALLIFQLLLLPTSWMYWKIFKDEKKDKSLTSLLPAS